MPAKVDILAPKFNGSVKVKGRVFVETIDIQKSKNVGGIKTMSFHIFYRHVWMNFHLFVKGNVAS